VPEDEEGEWEDFDRLKQTEDGSSQVRLTVNPEFMQRDEPSSPKNVCKGDRSSQTKSCRLTVTLFHRASVEWSYLSIDVFQDPGGTDSPTQSISYRQPGWIRPVQGLRDEVTSM
jgi:hypothetical protein